MNSVVIEDGELSKAHISAWHLTISSNQSEKALTPDAFKSIIRTFLSGFSDGRYFTVTPGKPVDNQMKIHLKFFVEVGHDMKRIHAHIPLLVEHDSHIQLNYGAIHQALPPGWYAHAKFNRGSKDFNQLMNYVRKELGKPKLSSK